MPQLILIGGGARSGKSAFAVSRAGTLGERQVVIATAEALDDEMRARIARHKADRAPGITTVEEPRNLAGALRAHANADVVLVDCLTLWLSNLVCDGLAEDEIERRVAEVATTLTDPQRRPHTVVVTNEVGLGLVPETALGRLFRDVAGRAHQRLAAVADEIWLGVLGGLLRLRPDPVTWQPPPHS